MTHGRRRGWRGFFGGWERKARLLVATRPGPRGGRATREGGRVSCEGTSGRPDGEVRGMRLVFRGSCADNALFVTETKLSPNARGPGQPGQVVTEAALRIRVSCA